jgi:shikimate kinase
MPRSLSGVRAILPNVVSGCTFAGGAVNISSANIYLIGPMGSGKTTIGQRLAKRLCREFLDNDHELQEQTGASVSLIFDLEGEEGFRKRETAMLKQLTARNGIVLATGGGTILAPENRELLSSSGTVVYLRTSVNQQIKRLSRDKTRPLLQSGDRKEKLIRLADERNALYEEVAHITFQSRSRSLESAAEALYQKIVSYWNSKKTSDPGVTES